MTPPDLAGENRPYVWQPSASLDTLIARAKLLHAIRGFFHERNVLEVETPTLCHTSVTDPAIESIPAQVNGQTAYLQTSPEYAMKRLLAAGAGSIYQLTKAYRQDELGRHHNPEFTMLEWYRLGFDHHELMREMDALLQQVAGCEPADRITYHDLFQTSLGIDPHHADLATLKQCVKDQGIHFHGELDSTDAWLHLLLSHCIEPTLGITRPVFIYDFPASQASLARILPTEPPVAARFEVYWKGIELANGFYELQSVSEQKARFEANLATRKAAHQPLLPVDEHLLSALEHGLPECAGVALGVDRLIMLALGRNHLNEVMAFPFDRA